MKYLLMLLFIGLMWGQEYDPLTGEILEKLYNPETGELIEKKSSLDSTVLQTNSKVNSSLKDISVKDLSKEQKKIYNQNKIRIKISGGGRNNGLFLNDFLWYGYIKESFFKTKKFNQTEFFEITGHPQRIKIAKQNRDLMIKYALIYPILNLILLSDNVFSYVVFLGGVGYIYHDYNSTIIDGSSYDDALLISQKYNHDLMVKIYNENN